LSKFLLEKRLMTMRPHTEMRSLSTMTSPEKKSPEEMYKTLMSTRVMIWDQNIARLRRKSAPIHRLTTADVEDKMEVIFKKIEVILETSGDHSTVRAPIRELKTKLFADLASLKSKPANTEDSGEEMSGALKKQFHDKLELAAKPHDEKLPANAEPEDASKEHLKKDQDDDDVLDAHSQGEENLQPHANVKAVQDPKEVGGRTKKKRIKMRKPRKSLPSPKIKLKKEPTSMKMKKPSMKMKKPSKKKMKLPRLSQKRKPPKIILIQNRVRNLLDSERRSQCRPFHSWKVTSQPVYISALRKQAPGTIACLLYRRSATSVQFIRRSQAVPSQDSNKFAAAESHGAAKHSVDKTKQGQGSTFLKKTEKEDYTATLAQVYNVRLLRAQENAIKVQAVHFI